MSLLEGIRTPADVKKLERMQLDQLAEEMRHSTPEEAWCVPRRLQARLA